MIQPTIHADISTLISDTIEDVATRHKIFSRSQFGPILYVEVLSDVAMNCTPFELTEIKSNKTEKIDLMTDAVWDGRHPWLDIPTEKLNNEIGHHLYRISFINIHTNVISYLYFEYTLQCNNPDKPYVYMDQKGECACATHTSEVYRI